MPPVPAQEQAQEHPTVVVPRAPSHAEPRAGGRRTEGTAVLALVLAAVSWVTLPVVLAVVALLLAGAAQRSIDADPDGVGGSGLVRAARWVAWLQLLVVAMAAAFLGAFFLAIWLGR